MKKLTLEDKAEIIKILEQRRIYFEPRNKAEAIKCSKLILKLYDEKK